MITNAEKMLNYRGPPKPRGMPKKDQIATVLLVLSPVAFFSGLWLIFQQLPAIDAIQTVDAMGNLPPGVATRLLIGTAFTTLGFLMFVSSLGMYSSKSNARASRWLWWLGKWRLRILR